MLCASSLPQRHLAERDSPRASNASSSSALDHIRPDRWADDWNDELLDLIRVLTITLDRQDDLEILLNDICKGPLIPACDLPQPTAEQRKVPV